MAEEWVKDARNDARVVDNLHAEVSKSLATSKRRYKDLALKLATANMHRKSAEASLRTADV